MAVRHCNQQVASRLLRVITRVELFACMKHPALPWKLLRTLPYLYLHSQAIHTTIHIYTSSISAYRQEKTSTFIFILISYSEFRLVFLIFTRIVELQILITMSSEKAQKDQNMLYPKVEEVEGTNPPQKEQAVLYPKVEEVEGTNTPQKEQAVLYPEAEEVQGTNPPTGEHGEAKNKAKWGTHIMGAPAAPSAHPQNQEAATWTAGEEDYDNIAPNPYLVKGEPAQPAKSPMEAVMQSFNKWTKKAENLASNVWMNLKTGQSVPDVAWGKLSLGAKALTEGGFESLFKQTFPVDRDEKLRKTFACYFSTSTGPVAGTLYISTAKIAFCSDRPLSYTVPSGEQGWSYYRVAIPLVKLKAVNHSVNKDNPAQKYIQVVTVDNHEFWFMGFVNYEKALATLEESISSFNSPTSYH